MLFGESERPGIAVGRVKISQAALFVKRKGTVVARSLPLQAAQGIHFSLQAGPQR